MSIAKPEITRFFLSSCSFSSLACGVFSAFAPTITKSLIAQSLVAVRFVLPILRDDDATFRGALVTLPDRVGKRERSSLRTLRGLLPACPGDWLSVPEEDDYLADVLIIIENNNRELISRMAFNAILAILVPGRQLLPW